MFLSINIKPTKEFAFYLQLKLRTKGKIYNWNYNRLSKITGLSYGKCHRLLNNCLNQGLIEIHGTNLNITSLKYFKQKEINLVYTDINSNDNYRRILNKLKYLHFRFYIINRQKFVQETKRAIANPGYNKRHLKLIKKCRKLNINLDEREWKGICFGYRKVGKILGINISSVKGFLRWMKSMGYIQKWEENIVKTNLHVSVLKYGSGYYYNNGGIVMNHLGTRILIRN